MIKSRTFSVLYLILCTISVINCAKRDVLAIQVDEVAKSKIVGLQITKNDLDKNQLNNNGEDTSNEPKLTISEEFVAEKTPRDLSEEASKYFEKGLSFIERGKGFGRDAKVAATTLFETAGNLGHTEAKKIAAFSLMFGDYARWALDEAKDIFDDLAAKGSADAQLALGFMHATGAGVGKSNQGKAIIHYMFSALAGSPLAQMAMGFRYFAGVGVPANCESALSFYQKAAKTVVDNVRLTTSQSIQKSRLIDEVDPTLSIQPGATPVDSNMIEYYRMIAEKGDISAQLGLGQIYLSGSKGVKQNFELAFRYFQAAADQNNVDAVALLGRMYLEGTSVTPKNYETAFDLLLKAAEKGSASAQATLGIMFLKGIGVKKNLEKAYKLLLLASDKKNVEGQLYLGEMNFKGIPTTSGVKRDFIKALKFYQLAAQNGHILGYYNLAQMHATGTGVTRSCYHAVEFYKSVAERGKWGEKIMEAYNSYKEGRTDEAAMKYMFLAELGFEVAQTNLAFILDRGEASALFPGPREKTFQRAFVSWKRSADQEFPMSRVKLGDYYYYGLGTKKDLQMAFNNYKIAVDRHAVAQAMFNLGYMYEVGQGISRDLYLAKRFYDQAIESSLDAYLPATMALVKLKVVYYLELFNEHPLVQYFETMIGPNWDLIAMTVLLAVLIVILIRWIRNRDDF